MKDKFICRMMSKNDQCILCHEKCLGFKNCPTMLGSKTKDICHFCLFNMGKHHGPICKGSEDDTLERCIRYKEEEDG
jgi:hypothetical protein